MTENNTNTAGACWKEEERLKISGLPNILIWPKQSFRPKQFLSAKKPVSAESPKERKAERLKPKHILAETEPKQYSVDHYSCISYDLKRCLHFLNISLRYDIASHGKRRDVHKFLRHHIKIFPCETVLEDGIKCTALQLL